MTTQLLLTYSAIYREVAAFSPAGTLPANPTAARRLQGVSLPDGVRATQDMLEVVRTCSLLLMVIPAPFVARTLQPIQQHLRSDQVRSLCLWL